MTEASGATRADQALKAKHRAMWALGDYPAVAHGRDPRPGAGAHGGSGVQAGDRVLDVAAGSGNAAIPAALAGADVVASDLTPELLEAGGSSPPSGASNWSGAGATPRRCRSRTPNSTR